jgi:hypothetical protein
MSESAKNSTHAWDWFITAAVFLAFLVMLASLIGPRVGSHRASLGMQKLNNLFQIGIAFTNYATANNGRLPDERAGNVNQSWRLMLCAALDRSDIAREYRMDRAWNDPSNREYTNQWIPVMTSPHRPKPRQDAQGRGYADYGLISGPGTVNPPEGPVTLDFISEHDGLGQTLLVGECSGLQLIWTEPRDPDVSREKIEIATVISSKPKSDALLSSYSQYGVCGLFADGSGKQLSKDIDPKVLAALCTVNGGEKLSHNDVIR